MTDAIHGMTFAASIVMIAAGLWRIDLSAMLIGVGLLLLLLVAWNRIARNRRHGDADEVA